MTRELRSRLCCDGDVGERLSCEVRRESDKETELRSATARGKEAELRQCDSARERLRLESVRI